MDSVAEELARYLVGRRAVTPPDTRLLVGVSGIPASGKSCLARIVVEKCNRMLTGDTKEPNCSPAVAILIGLDGWHLTRAQLDAMPDPKLAHDHRGAHWTFDANGFASFVEAIRKPLSIGGSVKAPTFDHAKKDPEFDAVEVLPHHTIVVIEGLYTFLSIGTWKAAGEALDERWFIDLGVEEAKRRLVARHVHTGVAKNMEEAIWRAEKNDMPNGQFVIQNMLEPTRKIPSVDDPSFVTAIESEPES